MERIALWAMALTIIALAALVALVAVVTFGPNRAYDRIVRIGHWIQQLRPTRRRTPGGGR